MRSSKSIIRIGADESIFVDDPSYSAEVTVMSTERLFTQVAQRLATGASFHTGVIPSGLKFIFTTSTSLVLVMQTQSTEETVAIEGKRAWWWPFRRPKTVHVVIPGIVYFISMKRDSNRWVFDSLRIFSVDRDITSIEDPVRLFNGHLFSDTLPEYEGDAAISAIVTRVMEASQSRLLELLRSHMHITNSRTNFGTTLLGPPVPLREILEAYGSPPQSDEQQKPFDVAVDVLSTKGRAPKKGR